MDCHGCFNDIILRHKKDGDRPFNPQEKLSWIIVSGMEKVKLRI